MSRIAWLVPAFLEGSGGHRTMFQNIQVLAKSGHEIDVYVEDNGQVQNDRELYLQVKKYFGIYDCNLILGWEKLKPDYSAVFATVWYSAKVVRDLKTDAKKIYFIQDFEALFNPMGDAYLQAVNSYSYGLRPITIGRWLSSKMSADFKTPSQYFDFCADKEIYHPLKISRENSVCFIYQPEKSRRCNSIGIEALGIVKHLRPNVKICLYGSKEKGNIWFEHENLGIISLEKCNELYNRCSVGLCLSSSNPSRIPFEMMSAGLPVVDLYMENNLYDMPDGGVLLARHTPESIAAAVIKLLDDAELRNKMSKAGIKYMEEKSLEFGYGQFLTSVNNILEDKNPSGCIFEKTYTGEPFRCDNIERPDFSTTRKTFGKNEKSFTQRLKNIRFLKNSRLAHAVYRSLKSLRRRIYGR